MCGIGGYIFKDGRIDAPTGSIVLSMLERLACRGPDGSGIAVWRDEKPKSLRFRVAASEVELKEVRSRLGVHPADLGGEYTAGAIAVELESENPPTADEIERALKGFEILAFGGRLDLVKRAQGPASLEELYSASDWTGPMALGHTRMSQESKIDLSHSQPFYAHGVPDLAFVHNGHITNYHRLRRQYEQEGVVFYTENDSEVIGVYLRDRLSKGRTLEEAMQDSVSDLDGAFNYIVGGAEGLGVVRDRFGFKPLVVLETDDVFAAATEEQALEGLIGRGGQVYEPPPGFARFVPLGGVADAH
jgi:methylamine---glutamate N-methyltransferase subunit A